MSRIGIEETAPVRAKLLDRFLGGHGSLSDALLSAFNCGHIRVRAQVLNDALRNEEQSGDNGDWQKHIHRGARNIDPEVADGLSLLPREATDQRYCNRNTGGG